MRRRSAGFTLVELVVVVLIVGILAGLGGAQLNRARERAYFAALRTELKGLQRAQEMYYLRALRYTDDPDSLGFAAGPRVTLSDVSLAGGPNGDQGWSAHSTHEALSPERGCVIYDGAFAGPVEEVGATATRAGVPACAED